MFVAGRRCFSGVPTGSARHVLQSSWTDAFVRLPSRSTLEVSGRDAVKFLQGLTTNQMSRIEKGGDGILCAFLSPQGRMLLDAFIFPVNKAIGNGTPTFILDLDSTHATALEEHLKRYILRNKIQLRKTNHAVVQTWGPNSTKLWGNYVPEKHTRGLPTGSIVAREGFTDIGCRDPRHPDLGIRFLMDEELQAGTRPNLPEQFEEKTGTDYHLRRTLLGIPEGADDIQFGVSLPLESNLDYMSGVDFRKGCYLGQELTIRTYHTGVTRKRIVPVQFYDIMACPPVELSINTAFAFRRPPVGGTINNPEKTPTRSIGRMGSSVHNIGLALMRLEHVGMDGLETSSGLGIKGFVPDWWPTHAGPVSEVSSTL